MEVGGREKVEWQRARDVRERIDLLIDARCTRSARAAARPRQDGSGGKQFAHSAIAGLARLDGWPVAILANDPYHCGGVLTADASMKVTRSVELPAIFHCPWVHFVDNSWLPDRVRGGEGWTIHQGARALASVYQATVPWCSILVRKAFGVAGAADSNGSRVQYHSAWPSGDWGSLPIEGGLEAAYMSRFEASDHPDQLLKQMEERVNRVRS